MAATSGLLPDRLLVSTAGVLAYWRFALDCRAWDSRAAGYPGMSAAEGLAVLALAACAGQANAAVPPTVPARRIT